MARVEGRSDRKGFNVTFIRPSDKAWLVSMDGSAQETWFPKSQCDITPENPSPGDSCVLFVPEWLAVEKGWA